MNPLPLFDELPLRPGDPAYSAWGLWGENDELGRLNLLTSDVVRHAASTEILSGETVPLNLPLDAFIQPMNPVRKPCSHLIHAKGHANDDELDMNTQGSSHWDGLRHYPYQKTLQYYNGITQEDISGENKGSAIGVHNLAEKTVTGRGVLLDWYSWAQHHGRLPPSSSSSPSSLSSFAFDHSSSIPLDELLACARWQNDTTFTAGGGDILLIRTGWLKEYQALDLRDRERLPHRPVRGSCGVEASRENLRWHWDMGFSAVASDTVAYEAWPAVKKNMEEQGGKGEDGNEGMERVSLHEVFLAGWGMPIGESFDLEVLADQCRKRGKWSFFFVSVPLNVKGGVASPPGAVAIV